jgi:DNA-binding LacI/PurR family transcriptional regulator
MTARATIVDVARVAGVAVGTASDALNGKGRVAEATRQRISEAAASLGYMPDPGGRALVTGKTMALGIRIGHRSTIPEDGFFIDLLNGAAACAAERGYSVVITGSELRYSSRLDALIAVDPLGREDLQDALDADVPVVTVGRVPTGGPPVPSVDTDHGRSVPVLLDHLAGGAKAGPAWLISFEDRPSFVRDIEAAVAGWGKRVGRATHVLSVADDRDAVFRAVREQFERDGSPAMLIAVLARPAVWGMAALVELGLDVPGDVLVGSASDGEVLRLVAPAITALDGDGGAHGRVAVQLAIEAIGGGSPGDARLTLLPARLVVRASSSAPSAADG